MRLFRKKDKRLVEAADHMLQAILKHSIDRDFDETKESNLYLRAAAQNYFNERYGNAK